MDRQTNEKALLTYESRPISTPPSTALYVINILVDHEQCVAMATAETTEGIGSVAEYVSSETLDWIEPLWKKEQEEAQELAENSFHLFNDSEEQNEEGLESDRIASRSIKISGVSVDYVCDISAAGHGNEVWSASIAACQFLADLFSLDDFSMKGNFRCLELGAGAAIPSLFLANYLSQKPNHEASILVHITDLKRYHNLKPILLAVRRLPAQVRQQVQLKVSPHTWGLGVGTQSIGANLDFSFIETECGGMNLYDIVAVSDCIYDPNYHQQLLDSICATLKKPTNQGRKANDGGRVIITFSLHGNVPEDNVWAFFRKAADRGLTYRVAQQESNDPSGERSGWHMEQSMIDLGLWQSHMDPKRWIVHIYELFWAVDRCYLPVSGDLYAIQR